MLDKDILKYVLSGNDIDIILPFILRHKDYDVKRYLDKKTKSINVVIEDMIVNFTLNDNNEYIPSENYLPYVEKHLDNIINVDGKIVINSKVKEFSIIENFCYVKEDLKHIKYGVHLNNYKIMSKEGLGLGIWYLSDFLNIIIENLDVEVLSNEVDDNFDIKGFNIEHQYIINGEHVIYGTKNQEILEDEKYIQTFEFDNNESTEAKINNSEILEVEEEFEFNFDFDEVEQESEIDWKQVKF